MPDSDEQQLRVMLARLEGKLDTFMAQHQQALDDHGSDLYDHEHRLRSVEKTMHGLATKDDIESIESKRDQQALERQRKIVAWSGVILALVVPIESAIVAWLIQNSF